MTDVERLSAFVESHFKESKNTEFPTVREAAAALGCTHKRIESLCDEDPEQELFLTAHLSTPAAALGDHFVERYNEPKSKGAAR